MKVYGVVLIGCGRIGEQHIEDIYYRDNIKIVGVVDTNEEKAKLFAKKYNAEHWSTDYKELISLEETDIVIIASWVRSHYTILKECAALGKHVLCEKPLSGEENESEEAFKFIETAPVKVQIAMILRHNASYKKIKEIIDSGEIGKLKLIKMSHNHHTLDWGRYKALLSDCPSFLDCGVHYFDIISWFANSPIVSASGTSVYLDDDCKNENYGLAEMRTENGCLGVYEAAWSRQIPSEAAQLFVGEKGYIKLVLAYNRIDNREEGDLITIYNSASGEYKIINLLSAYKDMYGQLSALINSIETGADTVPTLNQARDAARAAFAAQKSSHEGRVVTL